MSQHITKFKRHYNKTTKVNDGEMMDGRRESETGREIKDLDSIIAGAFIIYKCFLLLLLLSKQRFMITSKPK